MSLLSDEEEWKLWNAQGIDDMNQAEAIAFARAYAAAILAKLAAKELPEPVYEVYKYLGPYDSENGFDECDKATYEACKAETDRRAYYPADQLTAWGNTRYAQGFAAGAAAQISRLGEKDGPNT